MRKIIIRDARQVAPFNEPARDLRVLNKPLWLFQRDVLARYCTEEREVDSLEEIEWEEGVETLVYRDNLFFDEFFFEAFIREAQAGGRACQVAFSPTDRAIVHHALPLQGGIRPLNDLYVADMWYLPRGEWAEPHPLAVDTLAREIGYYHVPTFMASEKGEMVFFVPQRAFLSIEHWVHVFMANSAFGIWAHGARIESAAERLVTRLQVLGRALLERKQVLSSSTMVQVGRNTQIDPTAIIQGPTIIGDNVIIGPGAVVTNSFIGNNVNIAQGCQVMLSVVCDRCFLPFRAALFLTTLMEDCIVAQNACLQCCVMGRNSFVGAGTTFTDFYLIPRPSVRTMRNGVLEEVGLTVIGSCIGHNCRIGSDLMFYPARMVESDTVLVRSEKRSVITRNISYEEGDQHQLPDGHLHPRLYPRDRRG
ncbi:MAG: multidrug transporter [Chloroflexota bacterium]|nr:multidrug transporter [Chloroflexota bacterium]